MASNAVVRKIGRYDVVDVLGRGGVGAVYRATDPVMDRVVAIKEILAGAETDAMKKKVADEVRKLAKLNHQNIVTIYDFGEDRGNPYLVMEYIDGHPLDRLMADAARFNIIEKLDIIVQTLTALQFAHKFQIFHRDIKPQNVMIVGDSEAKLIDFGIAREGESSSTQSRSMIMGTPHYMSKEQLSGESVDGRTDIYSCAVLTYQLLTGHLPFADGQNEPGVIVTKVMMEPTPSLRKWITDTPPELDPIFDALDHTLGRGMAKEVGDRYQRADEFAFDLRNVQDVLKRSMVTRFVEQARESVAKADLGRARDLLSKVLKFDTQNTTARQMLSHVRKLIDQQERTQRIRQLLAAADQALRGRDFSTARNAVNDALRIDAANADVRAMQTRLDEAERQRAKIDENVRRGLQALNSGDIEAAKRHIETLQTADPNDTQVNVLRSEVQRVLAQQERQKKIKDLLSEARKRSDVGDLSGALALISQAEAVDPAFPDVVAFKDIVLDRQRQEQRRRDIEDTSQKVQQAISAGNLEQASSLVDHLQSRYPEEPAAALLRGTVAKERDAAATKAFVEQQIYRAKQLLDVAKIEAGKQVLRAAMDRVPNDIRLQTLFDNACRMASDEAAAGKRREQLVRARSAMRSGDLQGAISTLELARREHGDPDGELSAALGELQREMQSQARVSNLKSVIASVERMLDLAQFDTAIQVLEQRVEQEADPALEALLTRAQRDKSQFQQQIASVVNQAETTLRSGDCVGALHYLQSQPAKSKVKLSAIGVGAVALAGVVGGLLITSKPATGHVSLVAVPYIHLIRATGAKDIPLDVDTPAQLDLPAGTYQIEWSDAYHKAGSPPVSVQIAKDEKKLVVVSSPTLRDSAAETDDVMKVAGGYPSRYVSAQPDSSQTSDISNYLQGHGAVWQAQGQIQNQKWNEAETKYAEASRQFTTNGLGSIPEATVAADGLDAARLGRGIQAYYQGQFEDADALLAKIATPKRKPTAQFFRFAIAATRFKLDQGNAADSAFWTADAQKSYCELAGTDRVSLLEQVVAPKLIKVWRANNCAK